ncbi:nuclear transport factor 2 family protein [Marinobacterium sediminicola]|uniref:SnoaL-like domain-containing protein n=1 Tax=Marinobacterium sediminicola TaxID=518898 RepID=A0ABY1S3V5_9GAMM|nr:nuclear transport factor 2 family protein [Marinobacterium sediminicola]ULG68248.1 nuclear transport factor 2 family protein [Marinobacterium sediminicola]SMR77782.1 SnoaL-like domain-containing protein [Marinobacterium sediminicola]
MTVHHHELALREYADAFASLTPHRIDALCKRVSVDIHFRDPFNDLYGRDALRDLLVDMFERAGRPGFSVDEICWHAETGVGWLRWRFVALLPVIGELKVEGASRVVIGEDGLVSEHLDFWDSAPIYLKLPFIGALLRKVRRKISVQE